MQKKGELIMKKKLVAVMGMLWLAGGVAYAGQSLVDFDGKDVKHTASSVWAGERPFYPRFTTGSTRL